ncbi:MAG TPA: hypothetical protein ENJ05_03210 [Thiotrichales bacterium]|nr:hypothetical protein [Thiotrichales bacterium]
MIGDRKGIAAALAPWLAGGSLALGHLAAANCTLTTQGRCSTCGSCGIALAALVGWALAKNRGNDPAKATP